MPLHQAESLDTDLPARLMDGMVLLAIDTETGGLDHKTHAITQVGLVGVTWEDGLIKTRSIFPIRFSVNIIPHPRLLVTDQALRVQGHTQESLAARTDAVPERESMRRLADVLSRYPAAPLIAHNATFDQGFLGALASRTGIPIPSRRPLICTKERQSLLQRQGIIPKGSTSLADCVRALGLEQVDNQHDASDDAALTMRLFFYQEAQRAAATGSLGMEDQSPYLIGQVGTIGEDILQTYRQDLAAGRIPAHEEPLGGGFNAHRAYRDLVEAAGQDGFPDLRGVHLADIHHTIDDTRAFVQGAYRILARYTRALAQVGRIAKEKGWNSKL